VQPGTEVPVVVSLAATAKSGWSEPSVTASVTVTGFERLAPPGARRRLTKLKTTPLTSPDGWLARQILLKRNRYAINVWWPGAGSTSCPSSRHDEIRPTIRFAIGMQAYSLAGQPRHQTSLSSADDADGCDEHHHHDRSATDARAPDVHANGWGTWQTRCGLAGRAHPDDGWAALKPTVRVLVVRMAEYERIHVADTRCVTSARRMAPSAPGINNRREEDAWLPLHRRPRRAASHAPRIGGVGSTSVDLDARRVVSSDDWPTSRRS